MKNKKRLFKVSLSFLIIILLMHNIFHFSFFGTGINGFYEKGISGFSIGKVSIGEEIKTKYRSVSPISIIILLASLTGLALTLGYLSKRIGKALPALPPQTVLMLLFFLLTKLTGF